MKFQFVVSMVMATLTLSVVSSFGKAETFNFATQEPPFLTLERQEEYKSTRAKLFESQKATVLMEVRKALVEGKLEWNYPGDLLPETLEYIKENLPWWKKYCPPSPHHLWGGGIVYASNMGITESVECK